MNNINKKQIQTNLSINKQRGVIPDKPHSKLILKTNSKSKPNLSIYSMFYAFIIVATILIYYVLFPLLNLSGIKDKGIDLLKSYYIDNKYKSLMVDFLFSTMLLKLADKFPVNIPIVFKRILVIFLFDVLLGVYINNSPYLNGTIIFLKEWAAAAGWFALVWDVLYISLIGSVADKIDSISSLKKNPYQLIIYCVVVFVIMHI
jgi:hypothetical protein